MAAKEAGKGLHFEFLLNDADEDEGLGHAGIKTYRNDPYAGTARESGQNSRDAYDSLPVRIQYDLKDVARKDVPGIDELESVIRKCYEQSNGKKKETAFFSHAISVICQDTIKLLTIADFNTIGAKGPSVKGNPFHTLLKANGVSVKQKDSSGGSFGIGKNAVFAVSDLQTVYYSTVYKDQGQKRFLAQGKSILISHKDEDGVSRRQTGYWGEPKSQPVEDSDLVPEWLKRNDYGTSVCVLGFKAPDDWAYQIAYTLIVNFFPAIHAGEMEFILDNGRHQITKMTLSSWFEDPELIKFIDKNERAQEFDLTRNLYECLVSPQAHNADIEVAGLGPVKVRVLVREGLQKKVLLIRNGMIITDNLTFFKEPFARFPMYRDFVCVVMPMDEDGSAFIKRLEDPQHRELSAADLPDDASKDHADSVMRRLGKQIRQTIKDHTLSKFEGEVAADEMRRYFAAPAENPAGPKAADEENPERLRYDVERRRKPPKPRVTEDGDGDGGNGGGPGPGPGPAPGPGPRPGPRPGPGPGPGPSDLGSQRTVYLNDLRNFKPAALSAHHRSVYFTPQSGGHAVIMLLATGLNAEEMLQIRAADGEPVSGSRIERTVEAGKRVKINVEFKEEYAGPIDVRMTIGNAERGASNEN